MAHSLSPVARHPDPPPASPSVLICGQLLDFLADPGGASDTEAYRHQVNGALWILDGRIAAQGARETVLAHIPAEILARTQRYDYGEHFVLPGLIDTHCHYPQATALAAPGKDLLDWLNRSIYPAEAKLADPELAAQRAEYFLERLLAHGTTTASVFATAHAHSVDAFMAAAEKRRLRMLCGKVMMDCCTLPALSENLEACARDCKDLIDRWHGRDRLRYSVTPRFAPTSSPEQLALAAALLRSRADLHLQSHLAENPAELAAAARRHPGRRDYLDIYAQYDLLGPRTIYAHGIHLSAREEAVLVESGTAIAHCPSSNLFLGSGFFPLARRHAAGVRIGLGSDIGAGTSFSMLRSLHAAHLVAQTQGGPLSPWQGWYLATLGGARALSLEHCLGNFEIGKEADCVVLDPFALPELAARLRQRSATENPLADTLFALMLLGDERCVHAVHILGEVQQPA